MMRDFLAVLVTRFEALEAELNALDAATGDGDHGSTILKGLRAAQAAKDAPAKAFRRAAGGASGSLFAQVVTALDHLITQNSALPDALADAAKKIAAMGQAKVGDKTMLDALIPASLEATPESAAKAARTGRDATRDMAAKRGRAKYVENAGVGHVDAGATSVAEILTAYATWLREAR